MSHTKYGPIAPNNCAVREHTADGVLVGRCFFYVGPNEICPRHGDVSEVQKLFRETQKLTNDYTLKKFSETKP